ncbi:MAG: MoxR family ATPase [Candidatus Ancillula sp.]|jgi:MoxR-like ATPase|nr:MoxR family ATPase [Candidatus Ancillula sp.]
MDINWFAKHYQALFDAVSRSFVGKSVVLKLVLISLLSRTHVLLEDVPGTGKTVLAKAVGDAFEGVSKRISFTPDLLPSDIAGVNVFNQASSSFNFCPGPIFANVVLADELNRASSKTQSGLLEAMEERQVTIDGVTHKLPELFFIIATQNPLEENGVYQLPEAQLDRFGVKTSIGYLNKKDALRLLLSPISERKSSTTSNFFSGTDPSLFEGNANENNLNVEKMLKMQQFVDTVDVSHEIAEYIMRIVDATRIDSRTRCGVSQRGAQMLLQMSRCCAAIDSRDYVTPDDVKFIATYSFEHRIILNQDAIFDSVSAGQVVQDVLTKTEIYAH